MTERWHRWKRGAGVPLGLLLALGLAPGRAWASSIGGTDAQAQYTGFSPLLPDSGIFTFNDTLNGTNPAPEPGTVTTADDPGLTGLVGGAIDLEIELDTSAYDPATGALLAASFIGTGPGSEVLIWDSPAKTSLLLALDVSFIDVVQAFPLEFAPPRGTVTLGNVQLSTFGIDSQLTVTGGSFAAAAGGVGTGATLQILVADPLPDGVALADLLSGGFWNKTLTVGFNTNPTSAVTWEINFLAVPEPGLAALLGVGLLALGGVGRSGRSG